MYILQILHLVSTIYIKKILSVKKLRLHSLLKFDKRYYIYMLKGISFNLYYPNNQYDLQKQNQLNNLQYEKDRYHKKRSFLPNKQYYHIHILPFI